MSLLLICPPSFPSHVLQTAAAIVGKLIAEAALAKNITMVAFDRGGFNYHGRVQVGEDLSC